LVYLLECFRRSFKAWKKGAGTKNHQFFAPEIGPTEGGVIQIQRPKNVAWGDLLWSAV
jgi:hypothetical protein